MQGKIYRAHKKVMGKASVKTVYLTKQPMEFALFVEHLAATIYTSTAGTYTTAKYIYVGFEVLDNKHYMNGHDVQTGTEKNHGVVFAKNFTVPAGARLFAEFEATATTEKYDISATGRIIEEETESGGKPGV